MDQAGWSAISYILNDNQNTVAVNRSKKGKYDVNK